MGNLITDAFVHMYQKHPDETAWADVSIAMWVGGGIRSSIDKKINGLYQILLLEKSKIPVTPCPTVC